MGKYVIICRKPVMFDHLKQTVSWEHHTEEFEAADDAAANKHLESFMEIHSLRQRQPHVDHGGYFTASSKLLKPMSVRLVERHDRVIFEESEQPPSPDGPAPLTEEYRRSMGDLTQRN